MGISENINEKTEKSDGKFTMSLQFPNDDYKTPDSTTFLDKLKEFENQILDNAVKNSKAWFGKVQPREQVECTFTPFLKYPKVKSTKEIDYTKPPTISAKVPYYKGEWKVEVYDTNRNKLFPCTNNNMTPVDLVPTKSQVAAVLQCGGIWFSGGKWGVTWKVVQCIVVPPKEISNRGQCDIKLSAVEDSYEEPDEEPDEEPATTAVEDSDEEQEDEPVSVQVPEPVPEPEQKTAKIVIKKKVVVAEKSAAATKEPAVDIKEPFAEKPAVAAEESAVDIKEPFADVEETKQCQ